MRKTKGRMRRAALLTVLVAGMTATAIGGTVGVAHAVVGPQSFTFLQAPFTQQLIGVSSSFLGGVAFASDGDPLVNECDFNSSPLHRFDLGGATTLVNGTNLFPDTVIPGDGTHGGGCGQTNHPNGSLYSNTAGGVVKLDPSTNAILAGPFGPGGNALGIAVDPQTNNLVYVEGDGTLGSVTSTFSAAATTFSTYTTGRFVDGIFFDPTGNFLFIADRTDNALTVLNRSGAFVQATSVPGVPDGIAFHSTAPQFVVTNNNDGTMTRVDYPANDFTQTGVPSVFASGGFRGDLSQVGPDGCMYLTQDGTRYDDGTVAFQDSLVRICPNFAVPPGVGGGDIMTAVAGNTRSANPNNNITATVGAVGVAVGDTVDVSVATGTFAGAAACSDTKGNSYTVVADKNLGTGRLFVCSATATTALSTGDVVTATYPGFSGLSVVSVTKISATASTGVTDGVSTASGSNPPVNSGNITTTHAADVLFAAVAHTSPSTFSATGGYAVVGEVSGGSGSGQRTVSPMFKVVSSVGVYNATGTLSGSGFWQAALVAYKSP